MSNAIGATFCAGCGWIDIPTRVDCPRCGAALAPITVCGQECAGGRKCPGLIFSDGKVCPACGREVDRGC